MIVYFVRLYKLYHIFVVFDSSFMQFYHTFYTVYMYNIFKYLLQFKLYLSFTCFFQTVRAFWFNRKNAASTGFLILQKLRHNIIAHIKSIIRQHKPVSPKFRCLFLHKCFHKPRINFLSRHAKPLFKFRQRYT